MIASSRNIINIACAIAQNVHRQPGLIFSSSLYKFLEANASNVKGYDVIDDRLIQKALTLKPDYREKNLGRLCGDDFGPPIYAGIAVKWFGLKIDSLIKLMILILIILISAFLIRFRENPLSDLIILAYLVTLAFFTASGFTGQNSYDPHGIPFIALAAMFYWLYSIYHSLQYDRRWWDWLADLAVGGILAFLLACRATVKIQIIGIGLLALILAWIFRKKIFYSPRRIINYFAPFVFIFLSVFIVRISLDKSLHPKYQGKPREHTFWHTVYVGLGVYPNKYGILYVDTCGYKHALISPYNKLGDKLNMYTFDYEEVLKKETLNIAKHDPLFIAEVFLKKIYLMLYIFYERFSTPPDVVFFWSFILAAVGIYLMPPQETSAEVRIFNRTLLLCGLPFFLEPLLAHPIFNKEIIAYYLCTLLFLIFQVISYRLPRRSQ